MVFVALSGYGGSTAMHGAEHVILGASDDQIAAGTKTIFEIEVELETVVEGSI